MTQKNKAADDKELLSIIGNLSDKMNNQHQPSEPIEEKTSEETEKYMGRLWDEFLVEIKDTESEIEGTATYSIDRDIIATLNQCDFSGKSNRLVINSILRAFLVDNLYNLAKIRKEVKSLFDSHSEKFQP